MNGKLVSIVLPVYNGEKYLFQSIESVLKQTYKNIELIIVNDCSTDDTENIILLCKSKDERIKYFKNDENLKLPKSLNVGFSHAKGTYFSWTSHDNFYEPTAIEKMVNYLEEHEKCALVSVDMTLVNEMNGDRKHFTTSHFFYSGNPLGACFLYRASIVEKVGQYNPSLFLLEDYDYWLRIYLSYETGVIHETLYNYRYLPSSLTISRKNEIIELTSKYRLSLPRKVYKSKLRKNELFICCDSLYDCFNKKYKKIVFTIKISLMNPLFLLHRIHVLIRKIKRKLLRK